VQGHSILLIERYADKLKSSLTALSEHAIKVSSQTFEINAVLAQRHITQCCLSYIELCTPRATPVIAPNNKIDDIDEALSTVANTLNVSLPLATYSHSRWALHASSIPSHLSEDIILRAIQLFQQLNVCLRWTAHTRASNRSRQEKNKPTFLEVPLSWFPRQDWPLYYLLNYSVTMGNEAMVRLLLARG
jgi:hypothetical protein